MKTNHLLLSCIAAVSSLGADSAALAASGRHGPAEISDDYVDFIGWTSDDSAYVYVREVPVWSRSETGNVEEGAKVAVVRSGISGARLKEFLIDTTFLAPADCSKEKCGSLGGGEVEAVTPAARAARKRLWALPDKKAFEAWRAKNPLHCRQPRNNYGSQDLEATAEPKRASIHAHGRRTFLGFFFSGAATTSDESGPQRIGLRLIAPGYSGGAQALSAEIPSLRSEGTLEGRVTVCMGPSNRRMAWLVERFEANNNDPGERFFHIGPNGGPRILLQAQQGAAAESAAQVDDALQKLNYALIAVEPTPRPTPGILVRETLDAAAGAIAAQLPALPLGKLPAKSPYDIVIAPNPSPNPSPAKSMIAPAGH